MSGWPETRRQLATQLRPYWPFRDELTVDDGIIMKSDRIVIPLRARSEILAKLHLAHHGVEKTRLRARSCVYWININCDIENMIQRCDICQRELFAQPSEPLMQHEVPSRPWQVVGTDLFSISRNNYLIIGDYYSKFPFVELIEGRATSDMIVKLTKRIFSEQGVPDRVVSYNGGHFDSQAYKLFAKAWGFEHVTSSPHYPRSNGFVERQIQTIKRTLKKVASARVDTDMAMLILRSTPIDHHLPSPAEMLNARKMRANLPVKILNAHPEKGAISERLFERQRQQKVYHDQGAIAQLTPLVRGQPVRIQHHVTGKWNQATIETVRPEPRSYDVRTASGGVLRRNRVQIRRSHETRPITESWANIDITDAELGLTGYVMFRKDRIGRRGGGVILYVKESIQAYEIKLEREADCDEAVWCKIVSGNSKLTIGLVYRSPNINEEDNTKIKNAIKEVSKGECIIMGDFNHGHIQWNSLESTGIEDQQFLCLIQDSFLTQHVLEPTRGENVLDIVLSSQKELVDNVKIFEPLGNSDHNQIHFDINVKSESKNKKTYKRNFHKGNYKDMRKYLAQLDWNNMLMNKTAIECWNILKYEIESIIDKFVPFRKQGKRCRKKHLSKEAIRKIMLKQTMWRVYRRTRKEEDYAKYKEALNAATTEIRQSKRSYEQKLACNIKNDSKSFYAYVRSKQNVQDKVGPLEDSAGNIISQGFLMAEDLNGYFSSVFTKEDISSLPVADAKFQGAKSEYLGPLVVTPELVAKKIRAMKDNKSPGVDGIPPKLLMETVDQISIPLARVFNLSLKEGVVPFEWKEANIIPLFKKGSRNKSENYRPESLTSVICKLLERLIKDHMVDFLVKHKLLNSSQHGFLKARSCLTNMLCFLEEITKWIDVGSPVDIIYLDFQKAFDKVPHQRLLLKLKAHGIGDSITDWIEQWLTDRRQRVVVDGEVSNWKSVLSGVPQGSVLGPILFLIYINDLDDSITSNVLKFADDTKLFRKVNTDGDKQHLQNDLDRLVKWSGFRAVWYCSFKG